MNAASSFDARRLIAPMKTAAAMANNPSHKSAVTRRIQRPEPCAVSSQTVVKMAIDPTGMAIAIEISQTVSARAPPIPTSRAIVGMSTPLACTDPKM